MMKTKSNKFAGLSFITALAASLCCITPILALISGASGIAASFSWLEPLRPYLIGITIIVLGFAWFQKLRPTKKYEIECACEEDEKPNFWQSKKFLALVTIFAVLMLAFPYYSEIFYSDNQKEVLIVNQQDIQTVNIDIEGMTCEACNGHIKHAAYDVEGVFDAVADYKTGKAEIKFDKTKTSAKKIIESINKTAYKVVE